MFYVFEYFMGRSNKSRPKLTFCVHGPKW
jgi:hypothetical protein